jgi:hypothetical protein
VSAALIVIAVGSWLGYRYLTSGSPFPLAPASSSSSAHDPSSRTHGEPALVRPPEAPRAAPADEPADSPASPEREDEASSAPASPNPRAPIILHSPELDAPRGSEAAHKKEARGSARPLTKEARRVHQPAPALSSPAAVPAAAAPAPAEPPASEQKPKHRTGSSLSTDQF